MERGRADFQWVDIATRFPATLVKDIAPEKLQDGQTPDAYGMGIDKQGVLYRLGYTNIGERSSTWVVVGTPLNPPASGLTWKYQFNRLWGYATNGNKLYYGAPGNVSNYFVQDMGSLQIDAEDGNITGVYPFGGNLGIAKASNLYVVPNADNTSGGFSADMVAEQGAGSEANMVGMGDVLFIANANGVWGTSGQDLQELTRPIRENLGTVSGGSIDALNADFERGRIIGSSSSATVFVIEPGGEGGASIFAYDGSEFRFTTRSLMGPTGGPVVVDKISLSYEYTGGQIDVSWQVKINDTWKAVERVRRGSDTERGRIELATNSVLACRRWAMRLTDIPSGFYIHRIQARVKMEGVLGYATE